MARVVKKIPPYAVSAEGKPILPMKLGILTLVDLGTVIWDNNAFHNQRYIWPAGFETIRPYASAKYPDRMANYTCKVRNVEGSARVWLSLRCSFYWSVRTDVLFSSCAV